MCTKLEEARKKLKEEEYKLRWGGYSHPYNYVTSSQYVVTRHWRNKVKELEDNMEREEKFAYIIETEMAIMKAVHRGHKCTDSDKFAEARKRVEELRRELGIKSDKK